MTFKCSELIKIQKITFTDENMGELRFKAEIFQTSEKQFQVDLYQQDIFSFQPTGENEDVIADEIIWISAQHYLVDEEVCQSVDECMQKVFFSLKKYFQAA